MKKLFLVLIIFLFFSLIETSQVFAEQNQNQEENKNQVQNQGETTQVQSTEQEQEQNQDQEQEQKQEQKQEQTTSSAQNQTGTKGEEAQKTMNQAGEQVQKLTNLSGEVGEKAKKIVQEQSQAQEKIENAFNKINSRQDWLKFLIGPDYGAIQEMKQEMEQNQVRIKELEQLQNQTSNQADQTMLQETIQVLNQENTALQNQINQEESGFSLLGWLFKFFSELNL